MPPPDDHSALLDIAHYARRALSVTDPLSEEDFYESPIVVAAVERWLSVVGEAVKRLTPEFRMSHGEIPWRAWAGLRDILVHAYDDVEYPQVWQIVTFELEAFLAAINTFLEGFESPD